MAMKRILVVDDDPNSRKIVELMLMAHGYSLLFADNGLHAIELALHELPDLILMDMLMPVMNGHEATQRIKEHPSGSGIPIVALTALAFESDRREALQAGCDGYLSKPFTRRDLVETVKGFLPDTQRQALA